jgi:hypothetical protein
MCGYGRDGSAVQNGELQLEASISIPRFAETKLPSSHSTDRSKELLSKLDHTPKE